MGDIRVLQDQLELGVPVESAMLLAGYSFDEIRNYSDIKEISDLVKISQALFISKHLSYINAEADENPKYSQWLLERVTPNKFSPTQKMKVEDLPEIKSIKIVGIKSKELDEEQE